MKIIFITLIFFTISQTLFPQAKKNSYQWYQYGIEIVTEEKLSVVEADQEQFRCDGGGSNLWVSKLDVKIPGHEREAYLVSGIEGLGLRKIGNVQKEIGDSLVIYSVRAENNRNYGYVFLINDTLTHNNYYFGYLTTGSRPGANRMDFIRFRLFKGDINHKPLASKSSQILLAVTDTEHELVRDYSDSDTIIIGKDAIQTMVTSIYKKYSPGVSNLLKTYYSLPEKLGARKIGEHQDITRYLRDTVDVRWLFLYATFAHEMYHNVVGWNSIQQSIKKTRGNYTDKIYSYYVFDSLFIDVERIGVPPSNCIHRSFPSAWKTMDTYPLYIYPSTLASPSQTDGIYNLVDELGAYITSLIWYNDVLAFYYDQKMNNILLYGNYLANSSDVFLSCLCFKHYILHYLFTVRTSSPDIYSRLMGNLNFKRAIMLLNKKLNEQVSFYNASKNKIREELANEYLPFVEDEKKLKIDVGKVWDNSLIDKVNKLNSYLNSNADFQKIVSELGCDPGVPIEIIKE